MKKFKILFICGSGIATSTAAAMRCKQKLEEFDIDLVEDSCSIDSAETKITSFHPQAIVATSILDPTIAPEVKRFPGLPFITGVNIDKSVAEIAEYLKSL